MSDSTTQRLKNVGQRLSVPANNYCRGVLYHFRDHSVETATIDDLTSIMLDEDHTETDEKRLAVRLHHVSLPKLADDALVEYDTKNFTVRYRRNSVVENWLNHSVKGEESPL